MGLNWNEALKAGAIGLNAIQQSSQQNTELLYKQISQANMQRFQAEQAQADRDWRSSESKAEQNWRTEQERLNRESREAISKADIESRHELSMATLDATTAYQNAMVGVRQGEAGTKAEKQEYDEYSDTMENAQTKRDAVYNNWESTPEDKANADALYAVTQTQAELKRDNPEGFKIYKKVYTELKPTTAQEMTSASDVGSYMATLDEAQAKAVRESAKQIYKANSKEGIDTKRAKIASYQMAIDQHRSTNPDSFEYDASKQNPQTSTAEPLPTNTSIPDKEAVVKDIVFAQSNAPENMFKTGLTPEQERVYRLADTMGGIENLVAQLDLNENVSRNIIRMYNEYKKSAGSQIAKSLTNQVNPKKGGGAEFIAAAQ